MTIYSIHPFGNNSINTSQELQNVKNPFLQKGFFENILVGMFNYNNNKTIDYRGRVALLVTKTTSSKNNNSAFILGTNPRIGYHTGSQKNVGHSLRSVAKSQYRKTPFILTFYAFCAIMVSYLKNLEGDTLWKKRSIRNLHPTSTVSLATS